MGCTSSSDKDVITVKFDVKNVNVPSVQNFFNDAKAFCDQFTRLTGPVDAAQKKFFTHSGFPWYLKGAKLEHYIVGMLMLMS